MINRLLILFLVLFCGQTYAQTYSITGKVWDGDDNVPLPGAILTIQPINKRALSNSSGEYLLTAEKGSYTLVCTSLGKQLEEISFSINGDTIINFKLTFQENQLEEFTIQSEKETTTGMSRLRAIDGMGIYKAKKNEVILMDDFAANKVSNTARQVFAKVPGLNIWESDFAGLQLDIAARGLGPSRTANFNTRQNGYDMSADALGYPESYYIPAFQAIERIEIVRGAASLQYGTQFGGMLNFKIRESPDEPLEIIAEQGFGSFGLLNTFISAGGRKRKLDYYAYYQYRQGDGWRESSGFNSHLAFGRLAYQFNSKFKLTGEYSLMRYEAQQPGGLTDSDFRRGDIFKARRNRNWFNVNWNLFALIADWRLSSMTQINVRTFGLLSTRNALGNLYQIGIPDNPDENRTLIRDDFQNFGGEARLLHRYKFASKRSTLVVGARYYHGLTLRKQGDANASSDPDFEFLNPNNPEEFDYRFPSRNLAFFAENLIYLSDAFSATLGLRLEHIQTDSKGTWNLNQYDFAGNLISSTAFDDSSSNSRTFPLFGLGLSYDLKEELNLYGNISQNFRSITFSDLRVVNPNYRLDSLITDENGFNADIGIRGKPLDWLSFDISAFLMRYNDRIGLYLVPGSTTLLRTNIGNSRHIGIESYAEANLYKLFKPENDKTQISIFANLAFTEATYIESDITAIQGRRVEYVPEVMLRTGINVKWRKIKATYQLSYLSDQFSDATNSVFTPTAISGIVPAYNVQDFSIEYATDKWKIGGGINNLTDEIYFTRRAESYPGPGIIPATIRSFYLTLGLKL